MAGTVLATCLGQLGYRVLLLEKASFPGDIRSTSFFPAPAFRVFDKIGALEEVKSAAPPMQSLWSYVIGPVPGNSKETGNGWCWLGWAGAWIRRREWST